MNLLNKNLLISLACACSILTATTSMANQSDDCASKTNRFLELFQIVSNTDQNLDKKECAKADNYINVKQSDDEFRATLQPSQKPNTIDHSMNAQKFETLTKSKTKTAESNILRTDLLPNK